MEFLERGAAESGSSPQARSAPRQATVDSSTPERLEALLDSLEAAGSVALIVGDGGTGKNRLALEAATALSARIGEEVTVISLTAPANPLSGIATHFGYHFPAILGDEDALERREHFAVGDADELGGRLVEIVEEKSGETTPIIVAPGIDQYSPMAAALLERFVHSRRCRVVATARRLSGAAAHLARDPRVRKIAMPPLTVEETRLFLVRLLGVENVELNALRRWYRVTEGNSLSLTLFALALDGKGLLGRDRGVVYELPGAEKVPVEFREFLYSICSEDDLRTLEVIAHAEPLFENAFISLLDAGQVARLHDQGIISVAPGPNGHSALSLRHQLLAAAVREQMSPARVVEVSTLLFDVLREELGRTGDPRRSPRLLFRMVAMGLAADRSVPLDWLWEAFEILRSGREVELRLRVALAIAAHPDASTVQFATAALQAGRIARLMGDRARLGEALVHIREAVERSRRASGIPERLQVSLYVALATHLTLDVEHPERALQRLDEADRRFAEAPEEAREALRTARVVLLAGTGRLLEAFELAPAPQEFGSMPVEWERAGARVVSSLILSQRGEYERAIRLSEYAESIVSVGEQPQRELSVLLGFCGFIGFWSCGALESAREVMQTSVRESFEDHYHAGVVDICAVLMSLADGKWRLSAQRAERLVAKLGEYDRYGLSGFANAALALALAALGERAASRRAIRLAENRQPGLSQTLSGLLRVLTLRARQWNGEEDLAELCLRVASWARAQQLPAIELDALHALAMEDVEAARVFRSRLHTLAEIVEPLFSVVLLEHCEELFERTDAWDTPATRRLTEFGLWMPLPQTGELSAREREIALFASLGYSSRWIAEQFHLSVRTVDTHLRHVFTKLRVSGRDELRLWFRRDQNLS